MTDQEKTRVTEVIFSSDELGQPDGRTVVFDPRRVPRAEARSDREGPTLTVPDAAPGSEPTVVRPRPETAPAPDALTIRHPAAAGSTPRHVAVDESLTRFESPAPRVAAPAAAASDSSVTPILGTTPSGSFARRHLGGLTLLERKLVVGTALGVVVLMLLAYLIGFAVGLG